MMGKAMDGRSWPFAAIYIKYPHFRHLPLPRMDVTGFARQLNNPSTGLSAGLCDSFLLG